MRACKFKRIFSFLLVMGFSTFGLAAETAAAAEQSDNIEDLAVTVYNGNYAIIRELRNVNVSPNGSLNITGVPTTIDPTTVSFKCVSNPAARLLEHNYQYDLVSTDSLLNRFIDREITVLAEGASYSGELLSYDARQIILKTDSGIVMIQREDNVQDIRFGKLPEGLLTRPTLMCLLAGVESGKNKIELSYQAGGVNWHSEYVMILNENDTAADISGWVSLDNHSGRSYENALFKFMAGDVRRQQPRVVYNVRKEMMMADAAAGAPMQEKSFFEYHMYTMPRRTTLANKETKQLELFSPARNVKILKRYVYDLSQNPAYYGSRNSSSNSSQKISVQVEFENSKDTGLGKPLPAGNFRVFKTDTADNSLQFVGENHIDHTPKDEKLSFEVGKAFDLVGQWSQQNVDRYGSRSLSARTKNVDKIIHESYEVRLRNRKDNDDVIIRVKAPLNRNADWKIIKQNVRQECKKEDSSTVYWDLPVKAGEEVVLEYTVEYEIE